LNRIKARSDFKENAEENVEYDAIFSTSGSMFAECEKVLECLEHNDEITIGSKHEEQGLLKLRDYQKVVLSFQFVHFVFFFCFADSVVNRNCSKKQQRETPLLFVLLELEKHSLQWKLPIS
jgi:hypothetical protein